MLVHPRATKFLPGQALVRYDLVKIHEDVHFRGSGNTASCWEVFVFWRSIPQRGNKFVDSSWNMMAHGDSREGKWRGNCRMRWVASTLHTTSEHVASSITNADSAHLGCQQSIELTPPPADLNGLARFAERRNPVYAHVPSNFFRPLPQLNYPKIHTSVAGFENVYGRGNYDYQSAW